MTIVGVCVDAIAAVVAIVFAVMIYNDISPFL